MSIKGFGHYLITEAAQTALQERAEKYGVPVEILNEVFDRGVLAWDESTQKTPSQYAFNRVDSFLTGGFAAKMDSDLVEVDSSTLHSYIRKSNHVLDHADKNSKSHKKSKDGIERAERLLNKKAVKGEINEEKTRHPTEKKAYVEPFQTNGESGYKASNKHGKVKWFNKHGRESAFKHAGMSSGPRKIEEVSAALAHKYVDKAEKSIHSLEDGPYSNAKDNKAFKRKMYIGYAKNKKLRKEENNVVDTSGEELKEGTPVELTKLLAMKRRETRRNNVKRRYSERYKDMRDMHRTEMALSRHAVLKRQKNSTKLIDRSRHQKTDRWQTQKQQRVAALRDRARKHNDRQIKVTEGVEYIEARKKLHDAHHESARLHAGMERDPELRRMDLHRAKRHKHASRVLEIIQSKKNKGKDKDKK